MMVGVIVAPTKIIWTSIGVDSPIGFFNRYKNPLQSVTNIG